MYKKILAIPLLLLCLFACDDKGKNIKSFKPYTGPVLQANNIATVYSDSAKRKVEVSGPLQNQYKNSNLEYPKGMTITFYNNKEQKSAMLKGDKGFFDKNKNLYTATGDVVVIDMIEKKVLKTEELYWNPADEQIYTDKFVVLSTPKQIIKGTGFRANQDFSQFNVLKPTAIINVEDENKSNKSKKVDSTKADK